MPTLQIACSKKLQKLFELLGGLVTGVTKLRVLNKAIDSNGNKSRHQARYGIEFRS